MKTIKDRRFFSLRLTGEDILHLLKEHGYLGQDWRGVSFPEDARLIGVDVRGEPNICPAIRFILETDTDDPAFIWKGQTYVFELERPSRRVAEAVGS